MKFCIVPWVFNVKKLSKLLFIVILITEYSFSESKSDTITIASFEYPQIYQNDSNKGIALDIVQAAFKASAIETKFQFYPVARMIAMVNDGQALCGVGGTVLFENSQTKNNVHISEPIQYVLQVFLYDSRKFPDSIVYKSLDNLSKHRIGALYSSGINKFLEKNKSLQLDLNATHEGSAKQLHMNRIDLWAIVDITGMWYLNKLYPSEIKSYKYTKAFNRGDICVVFSNKQDFDSSYSKAFKSGFAKIKSNGDYIKIMAKYYGSVSKINRDALTNDMQSKLPLTKK